MINFLDTYLIYTQAGKTEIPMEYFLWTGLSAIAGAVADRVYFEHHGRNIPNLYTLLVGDSASGKGHAITKMEEVLEGLSYINATEIRTSAPALMDLMSAPIAETDEEGRRIDPSKIFIITPELKDNIGSKGKAEDFISWATSIWEGARPVPIVESTRGAGTHVLTDHCLNWVAGSNKQWLMESITVSALQGGFFGRVACVMPTAYDLNNRHWDTPPVKDKAKLLALLKARLRELTHVEGVFKLESDANDFLRNWYMTRPAPDSNSPIAPVWKRMPQMVNKLCMLLSLSESNNLVITATHAKTAKELVDGLLKGVQNLLVFASVTPKTETMYRMSVLLRQSKKLPRNYLLKQLGTTIDDFELALRTLIEAKAIKVKGALLSWIGA